MEIWRNVAPVVPAGAARRRRRPPDQIAAVGITNQRETTRGLGPAHRDAGPQRHRLAGHPDRRPGRRAGRTARQRRGRATAAACRWPPTSPRPSSAGCWTTSTGRGTRAERGDVLFGTMDSWLIWNLTGGTAPHVTDVTNASRTMLMNLTDPGWDDELLAFFDMPRGLLPRDPAVHRVHGKAAGCARRRHRRRARATSTRPCSGRPASPRARPSAPTAPAASC